LRSRPTAARRRVRTALGVVALLAAVFGTVWVTAPASLPIRDHDELVAASPILPGGTTRAPVTAAVLVTAAALVVLAIWALARRPALRPVPVPVRTPRGRGPPRSTSI
jgi:hypothetical protein